MDITQFHHLNGIRGQQIRPGFNILAEMGDKVRIIEWMSRQNPPLERIVLLEDFIGTTVQSKPIIEFALSMSPDIEILVCPLLIAQSGDKVLSELQQKIPNLSYEPTLVLDRSVIIHELAQSDDGDFKRALRDVVINTYADVYRDNNVRNYGPFGFNSEVEGGGLMIVLFSNCPANTIPMLHHSAPPTWWPLFPRSRRV